VSGTAATTIPPMRPCPIAALARRPRATRAVGGLLGFAPLVAGTELERGSLHALGIALGILGAALIGTALAIGPLLGGGGKGGRTRD
jgi:hypothetical protein